MSAVTTRPALRLPAYGRDKLKDRFQGLVPTPHPFFGHIVISLDDWKLATRFPPNRMVVFKDLDPDSVDFRMCAGLDIVLAWSLRRTPLARRDATIRAIMRCRPVSLRIVDMDAPREGFWVLSHGRGLERPELLK